MKKRVCSNKIKSSFALLMAMVMLLGASVYTVSAEGSDPSSDVGEPLYTVNFNGDSRFSPDFTNANVNASKEISSDGRSLNIVGNGDIFFGGEIKDMPLTAETGYEITYSVTRKKGVAQGFGASASHYFKETDGLLACVPSAGTSSYDFANYNIVPFAETESNGAFTQQYKVVVDAVGKTMTFYVLTEASTNLEQHYEKLHSTAISLSGNNLSLYFYTGCLDGMILDVTFSNVEVRYANMLSVDRPGELLLKLEDMTEAQTGSYGVTYTPDVDEGRSKVMDYQYDEATGVHSMNAIQSGLDASNQYNTKALFGGSTNLRLGDGVAYTVKFKVKMHVAGGDVGLAYTTKVENQHKYAEACEFQAYSGGQVAFYRNNYSNGSYKSAGYAGTNLFSANGDGYAYVVMEISGTDKDVTVYVNGASYFTYDFGGGQAFLSLALFDYTSGGLFADTLTHSSYKDIEVYSGLLMSQRYITTHVGDRVKTVGISAADETYILPKERITGKVMKGWLVNDGDEVIGVGEAVATENLNTLTAVFEDVMGSAYVQFGNKTDTTADMRIVGVIDSIYYKDIGYAVVVKSGDTVIGRKTVAVKNVYELLLAGYGTETVTLESLGYCDDGGYLTSFVIRDVPTNIDDLTIELTPYQVDFDDTETEGETITLVFSELWAKENAATGG